MTLVGELFCPDRAGIRCRAFFVRHGRDWRGRGADRNATGAQPIRVLPDKFCINRSLNDKFFATVASASFVRFSNCEGCRFREDLVMNQMHIKFLNARSELSISNAQGASGATVWLDEGCLQIQLGGIAVTAILGEISAQLAKPELDIILLLNPQADANASLLMRSCTFGCPMSEAAAVRLARDLEVGCDELCIDLELPYDLTNASEAFSKSVLTQLATVTAGETEIRWTKASRSAADPVMCKVASR